MFQIKGLTDSIKCCEWIRYQTDSDESMQVIHGTMNILEYKLTKEDVGCYIGFRFSNSNRRSSIEFAAELTFLSKVGPILPGPPRFLNFDISGSSECGGVAIATTEYIGGMEGASKFWWMRISSEGVRTQISEEAEIPVDAQGKALPVESTAGLTDPRRYVLKPGDFTFLRLVCFLLCRRGCGMPTESQVQACAERRRSGRDIHFEVF